MREIRIYYSGFEGIAKLQKLLTMIENGFRCRGILVSYLNLGKAELGLLKQLSEHSVSIMLDSGAHSFLYAWLKEQGKNIEMGHEVSRKAKEILENDGLDEYVYGLIDFVDKHRDIFDIAVELDVQQIVGMKKVEEWRGAWAERDLEPMYVWHGERIDEVREWLKKTRYIGIGGTGSESETDLRKRISAARQIKDIRDDVWIHWFAFTSFKELPKLARMGILTSADSTTWSMASRYGLVFCMVGNRFETIHHKDSGVKFKHSLKQVESELAQYGLDVEAIRNFSDWEEVNFYNLVISEKFVDHVNESISAPRTVGFSCVVCSVADRCAYFNEESEGCPLVDEKLKGLGDDEGVLEETIKFVIEERLRRYVRARIFEDLEGGILDKHVTALEDGIAKLIETYLKLKYPERYGKGVVVSESIGDYEAILKRLDEYDRGQE